VRQVAKTGGLMRRPFFDRTGLLMRSGRNCGFPAAAHHAEPDHPGGEQRRLAGSGTSASTWTLMSDGLSQPPTLESKGPT
jgi:hypothetical protein